jgi:catechol 2,3-dioxygenase
MGYVIPATARIGHVHLKVSNLQRSIDFYCGLLGFELVMKYGEQAAFVSAGGYHHHIGLNTWHSENMPPAPVQAPGLYHVAVLYETRKDLASIFKHLTENAVEFTGFADHGVSEALYLNDPDQNGLELYWDRPKEQWPLDEAGNLTMYTRRLDIPDLLSELRK